MSFFFITVLFFLFFFFFFFFFNDTATTEIYTLSLHDALPICQRPHPLVEEGCPRCRDGNLLRPAQLPGTPHTRSEEHTSNSSHLVISYAVFCLKKKKTTSTSSIFQQKNTNPKLSII